MWTPRIALAYSSVGTSTNEIETGFRRISRSAAGLSGQIEALWNEVIDRSPGYFGELERLLDDAKRVGPESWRGNEERLAPRHV